MTMDQSLLRRILWLGIEDYSGLWEARWEAKAVRPEESDSGIDELARRSVKALVDRGYLRLFRCQEPYGDMTETDVGEAPALLEDEGSWIEPGPRTVSIRISATPAGELAYREAPVLVEDT